MKSSTVQLELIQAARELGFSRIRFTRPPLGRAAELFADWLRLGYDGQMGYLARDREARIHPERLLPQLQSIIVLAHPYAGDGDYHPPDDQGKVSRYAWGEDYHRVLKEKLSRLVASLESRLPESHWYISVDAQAVLEKAWAEKAGLGWMGKHSNIINPEQGSYFFLSALLTDAAFPVDGAQEDRCGTCTRCIEVCPTRAIVAPYLLDANLCISYLTIESKGPIPRHLRAAVGNRIFGCDDCQEVCPWNRFSEAASELRFISERRRAHRSLKEWLCLGSGEFKREFRNSAMSRARWKGLMRNILVAAGNSGDDSLAPLVEEKLNHSVALIRGHAVWAYGRLLGEKAGQRLRDCLALEEDPWVMEELQAALAGNFNEA